MGVGAGLSFVERKLKAFPEDETLNNQYNPIQAVWPDSYWRRQPNNWPMRSFCFKK